MTEEIETRLLASIPTIQDFYQLQNRGITADSFQHCQSIYRYIEEIVTSNQHLPRLRDLEATFNLKNIKRTTQEFDWLVDEFIKTWTARRIQASLEKNVGIYGEEPQILLDSLVKDLLDISHFGKRGLSSTDGDAFKRVEKYAKRDARFSGIPTGISFFDVDHGLGWQKGELIGVVGRVYMGKTWILLFFGLRAWRAGHRVLFLSPELSTEEAEARFDVLYCGEESIPVRASDFFRGFKPSQAVENALLKVSDRTDWVTISSDDGQSFRLSEIPRLIRQHYPDLVLIDGLPFLAEGRKQIWEMIRDVSYGLKNVAMGHDVPIILAHQANRAAADTAKPPALHEIAFGDAYVQACDRVLALSHPKNKPGILYLTIQKFRRGQPLKGAVEFNFRPGEGIIHEQLGTGSDTIDGDIGSDIETGDAIELSIP